MRNDQNIECAQCKQTFVFTQEEQDFYKQKNLELPKFCLICRAIYQKAETDGFRGKIKNVVIPSEVEGSSESS